MKRCQYFGYSFKLSVIHRMNEEWFRNMNSVRHTSIQEYPDNYSADDILTLIEETFKREHPDFNLIDGVLVFL